MEAREGIAAGDEINEDKDRKRKAAESEVLRTENARMKDEINAKDTQLAVATDRIAELLLEIKHQTNELKDKDHLIHKFKKEVRKLCEEIEAS